MHGLGAAIMQEGKIDTESRYSNIEREVFAIVFGVQRFHAFLFARPLTVISDHKPLSEITCKPINTASTRLQRMLLQVLAYNFMFVYSPGFKMT